MGRRAGGAGGAPAREEAWPGKGINYRMHPANVPCLVAARLDCCVLANNHVLDWGRAGLAETLEALSAAGIRTAGAGLDPGRARAPAVMPVAGGGRVLVLAYASETSGVPKDWAARPGTSGVSFLEDLSPRSIDAIAVVHGHSSHHPRPVEIHRGRPILYGCGDFINDYEGIEGHEEFRPELCLMYFARLGTAIQLQEGALHAVD